MKTARIVLASLLKPVDDPRMYYKFAKSLASVNKYEINIIGFPSKNDVNDPRITAHPLIPFHRKSFDRWKARIQATHLIWKIRPDLLILNTHELLGVGLFLGIFTRARIVYDIRENYAANLRHRKSFAGKLFSVTVRLKEWIAAPFIDYFILAENSYAEEIPFHRNQYIVLENKALKPSFEPECNITFRAPPVKFLFSGTLSEQTGTLRAIEMIREYRKAVPSARLRLAGNSFDATFVGRLTSLAEEYDWLDLDIDEFPIPYTRILHWIRTSDVGIISYDDLSFLRQKRPTKFFEYTGNHLPVLYNSGSPFRYASDEFHGGLTFRSPCEELALLFTSTTFYPQASPVEIYWINEEMYLLELVDSL